MNFAVAGKVTASCNWGLKCVMGNNSKANFLKFSPPYYDTIINYRNSLEYGKKAQRNHEAYTTSAFPTKLQKINLISI